jgi:hypothetical protein
MQKILKTTLATTFFAACLAGSTLAFAADTGGKDGKNGDKGNTPGDSQSKDNKCANDASGADASANCTTTPNDSQQ